jgi:GT2 family glycosyltransferase
VSDLPAVSVVVPTQRRPDLLRRCLRAVAGLDYPADLVETIVVADGGASRKPVEELAGRLDVRFIEQASAGPAGARNHGLRTARYAIVAFTDDDCAPEPGWLRALVGRLGAEPATLAGGPSITAFPENPYACASHLLLDFLYAYYDGRRAPARFLIASNLAASRDRLEELGGFDNRMQLAGGEDRDLCERWRRAGWPVRFVEDAIVRHHSDPSAAEFWRRHFTYGRGASHLAGARARRGSERARLEPPRFYLDLVRAPLAAGAANGRSRPRAALLSGLLLASQAAYAAGFAWEETRRSNGPHRPEVGL